MAYFPIWRISYLIFPKLNCGIKSKIFQHIQVVFVESGNSIQLPWFYCNCTQVSISIKCGCISIKNSGRTVDNRGVFWIVICISTSINWLFTKSNVTYLTHMWICRYIKLISGNQFSPLKFRIKVKSTCRPTTNQLIDINQRPHANFVVAFAVNWVNNLINWNAKWIHV